MHPIDKSPSFSRYINTSTSATTHHYCKDKAATNSLSAHTYKARVIEPFRDRESRLLERDRDGSEAAGRGHGGGGAGLAGAGVGAGEPRRAAVVHDVADLQLHPVPQLHHQQHRLPDGRLLPLPWGADEGELRLRLPHPHRQRAARRARQPHHGRHAAQGLQQRLRPLAVPRPDDVGEVPSSGSDRRCACSVHVPIHGAVAARDAGAGGDAGARHAGGGGGACSGAHGHGAGEPGADEADGRAQRRVEGERPRVLGSCRRRVAACSGWSRHGVMEM